MNNEIKKEFKKSTRGFASMSKEDRVRIASIGGRAAHEQGVAHKWTASEAAEAGRKGGIISGKKRARIKENGKT